MCVCVSGDGVFVGMSKVWADMTYACVPFGPFLIASVSNSTSYWFNHLKTKHGLLYLKTQSVPCSKHFSSRL